ncbi:MAG: flagellar hook-associated protein FlgL [Granulosicoccus sp.]|nr:flagellar hook-associated protein FlgL [Granulosicoccus sp.]
MRISSSTLSRYTSQDMMKYQLEIADLQSQISSGKQLQKPSDDPVNAARQVNLSQNLSQIDQYNRNINLAEARLSNEESHIANTENVLLRVRELALISNNSATTDEVYPALAAELEQLSADLLAQANATDPDGDFLFAGTKTSTRPFSPGSPDVYLGDDQQRMIQVNQSHQMATSDSGKDIFMRIPASDKSHTIDIDTSNTGSASILLTNDGTGPNPGTTRYALEFPTSGTYSITNLDTGAAEVTGAAIPESNTIEHAGLQLSITGAPNPNDRFNLEPTIQQDVFKTLDKFIELLNSPPQSAAEKAVHRHKLNEIMINVDQAFEHMTLKRADIGSRLASLEHILQENESIGFTLNVTLSGIEDLDYADAISKLQHQATALEALQKTITRTQGLSLFSS